MIYLRYMKNITDNIIPVLKKYGVKKAALFGSYARGDFDDQSDVDILIERPESMGLSFISLKHDLEDQLHKKVDLVTYGGLNPHLKNDILSQQVQIL